MTNNKQISDNCFTYFKESIESISLPEKFTFPFYYEPHALCKIAAKELQEYIGQQTEWEWDFFNKKRISEVCMGKMFGVLVVKNNQNEIGYLSAFSGKIADKNILKGFVPPVFDMLTAESFYLKDMEKLNEINARIKSIKDSEELRNCQLMTAEIQRNSELEITNKKQELKKNKLDRKNQREIALEKLTNEEYLELNNSLIKESLKDKYELRVLTEQWKNKKLECQVKLDSINAKLNKLKEMRKQKSAVLQQKLFSKYMFLNIKGKQKGVLEIFENTPRKRPPAAAGECSAPKLLQYAFIHNLQPIAMAEFWLGQSPKTEIRKHGNFYPACKGKCEPILGHMLEGIEMDENPMLTDPVLKKPIEIIYEDDSLAVVNKPAEFLSVPGKTTIDSVAERMKLKYPEATGPLVVHRLDMATSGLMLIAKTLAIHKQLQAQFIKRKVKKTYVALLEGIIQENEGIIDLPLRVDLDDRPRQMVCYEHGKPAQTKWKVLERSENTTQIQFSPITGRTHQLRVHAAHPLGLNTPIVGDDLYGTKAERLHLHAEGIEFFHPLKKELLRLNVKEEF